MERREVYFFLFVALLGEILSSASHLCTAHGMLFGREVLLDLNFWEGVSKNHVKCRESYHLAMLACHHSLLPEI